MLRISGGSPAAGESFWSGLGDKNKAVLAEAKAPATWQVIAALAIYTSLIILIGVMLAGSA